MVWLAGLALKILRVELLMYLFQGIKCRFEFQFAKLAGSRFERVGWVNLGLIAVLEGDLLAGLGGLI